MYHWHFNRRHPVRYGLAFTNIYPSMVKFLDTMQRWWKTIICTFEYSSKTVKCVPMTPMCSCQTSQFWCEIAKWMWFFTWQANAVPTSEVLLPEEFRQQGYITRGYGKWHIGHSYWSLSQHFWMCTSAIRVVELINHVISRNCTYLAPRNQDARVYIMKLNGYRINVKDSKESGLCSCGSSLNQVLEVP